MRFGVVMPAPDPTGAVALAVAAESSGWDGFFMWEPVWGVDPWTCLGAAAALTDRIRLGTLLTPPSRRRPWKLASEVATLDVLSGGRAILSVGLGAVDTGFAEVGEETDRRRRAELVDESLAILTGLWAGQPFRHTGEHYRVQELNHLPPPPPVQQPRVPIWVVGVMDSRKSMGRALRYDGILPQVVERAADGTRSARQAQPGEVARMAREIQTQIPDRPFDIVVEGVTPTNDAAAAADQVAPWRDAGATWWIEAHWSAVDDEDEMERLVERVRAGPPRE